MTTPKHMKVGKYSKNELALTNLVYFNPKEPTKFEPGSYLKVKSSASEFIYLWGLEDEVELGKIGLSAAQRKVLDVSFSESVVVAPFVEKKTYAHQICFAVAFNSAKKANDKVYKVEQLEEIVKNNFENHYLSPSQQLFADVSGTTLLFTVTQVQALSVEEKPKNIERAILMKKSNFLFTKAKDSTIKLGGQASTTSNAIFAPNFNFEQMGIGGLDKEFASIFRRAFASRIYPAEVIANLGISHVKGLLLYGPPGTGKTLIARKIGQMLNAREPKIVNGPEVLNKFVGQSEENIRELFAEAEREYREKQDESELHIIIFDELDAICKERGSRATGGTGVGDSIVNQLLSKMDGVNQINNILIIGMTNRKDLIDEALLRPGRFEVHMEIGLPDESGRIQILNIHTAKLRNNNFMDKSVDINELASLTKNFSGAEIEGLVKSATSFALNRQVDGKNIKKADPSKIKVTKDDFMRALNEVRPAFGIAEEDLQTCIKNGIIPYSDDFKHLFESINLFVDQVRTSEKIQLVSLLLQGKPGSGKTALAAKIAIESEYLFVKLLTPENFVGYTEAARVLKINKTFEDAYKSSLSLIIVDDIERFLDYAPVGQRYSNTVLQALMVLFKKPPPKGRRLLILGTTSRRDVLEEMDFLQSVNSCLQIPSLSSGTQVRKVLEPLQMCGKEDLDIIERNWKGTIEIKKLITLADTANATEGGKMSEKFLDIASYGQ